MYDSFSHWLSVGVVCLLVGGTLAAKTVFLVDNELETQAELSREHWQLDRQFLAKQQPDLDRLTHEYIDRLTQLPDRQIWCSSAQEISLVLAKAKRLKLIELDRLMSGKAEIIVKLPIDRPNRQHLHLYVQPTTQTNTVAQEWCIGGRNQ